MIQTKNRTIGFTGTREGMTLAQISEVKRLLDGCAEFHHGDCLGADAEARACAGFAGWPVCVAHPPENPAYRAFTSNDYTMPEAPYLFRNRQIVDDSELLIAAPRGMKEKLRGSGTWSTVRYAREKNKSVIIIYPDGKIEEEGRGPDATN